jgi:hypothetical protein
MKQPRRLAAWLAAFLLAASLTALPREGAAWPPYLEGDPPQNEGEPDGPPPAPFYATRRPMRWTLSVVVVSGRVLVVGVLADRLPPRQPSPSRIAAQRVR